MANSDTSTESKMFKSPQWKQRKREQHAANVDLRAQLHARKAAQSTCEGRASVQAEIDSLSERG